MSSTVKVWVTWRGGDQKSPVGIIVRLRRTGLSFDKSDNGGVDYVVSPGDADYVEKIDFGECSFEDNEFRWRWHYINGQNHVITLHVLQDISLEDVSVEHFGNVDAPYRVFPALMRSKSIPDWKSAEE